MKKPFDPSDRENALKSALNLIRFRIRSEKELFYKLKEKGYDVDTINDTVQKLKENKLLDDRIFAKCFSYDKAALDGKGPQGIRYELKEYGISEDIISDTLKALEKEVDFYEIALSQAKKVSALKKDTKKVYDFLYRKGYDSFTIKNILKDIGGE